MAGRLARHPHAEVRRAAAANEATPPILAALLTSEGLPPAQQCLVCDREETPFVHDPQCPRNDCDLLPGDSCDRAHQSTVQETQQMAVQNPATPIDAVIHHSALGQTVLSAVRHRSRHQFNVHPREIRHWIPPRFAR